MKTERELILVATKMRSRSRTSPQMILESSLKAQIKTASIKLKGKQLKWELGLDLKFGMGRKIELNKNICLIKTKASSVLSLLSSQRCCNRKARADSMSLRANWVSRNFMLSFLTQLKISQMLIDCQSFDLNGPLAAGVTLTSPTVQIIATFKLCRSKKLSQTSFWRWIKTIFLQPSNIPLRIWNQRKTFKDESKTIFQTVRQAWRTRYYSWI